MVAPLIATLLVLSGLLNAFVGGLNTELPPYERGNGAYQWVLPKMNRDDGVYFQGSNLRLRRAMAKMLKGEQTHITTVGGSNTAGDVRIDGLPWPTYLFNYMQDRWGKHITGNNGAVGGTRSNYAAVCHNMMTPKIADVVVVEFAVNDGNANAISMDLKRQQERLIRKLLSYPHRPAVMLAHILPWDNQEDRNTNWWLGAEDTYNELLLNNAPGFNTTKRAGMYAEELKGISFYVDSGHIDGLTGARVLAELVIHALERTIEDLQTSTRAYDPVVENVLVEAPLPPPLYPGNYESQVDRCFIGTNFQQTVVETNDFIWVNEAKGSRPRWGMVARTPGASIKLKFDSRSVNPSDTRKVVVLLAHLKSYTYMGIANVTCVSGCECDPTAFDGHHTQHNSQTDLHKFEVTQAEQCIIQVTVGNVTLSGQHKIKLTGLVVSEQAGDHSLDDHRGAVENVGSVSAKSHSGIFDVANREP